MVCLGTCVVWVWQQALVYPLKKCNGFRNDGDNGQRGGEEGQVDDGQESEGEGQGHDGKGEEGAEEGDN